MPRSARLNDPGVLYHVTGRGIEKGPIFLSYEDLNDFLSRLGPLAEEGCLEVYAWALLRNHFHLLCKTDGAPRGDPILLLSQVITSSSNRIKLEQAILRGP